MIKNILYITFAIVFMFGVHTNARAESAIEIIENENQNITISVSQSTLHISGAMGQTLYIYNVTGVCVMSIKIDSADKRCDLNIPKGCYIVKVGRVVRKISVR